jgi:DNA helicase-2/ATP-dependent DNA helicase PcrA
MSSTIADPVPQLEGDAEAAVAYREGHLQIIAAAGSGKTEVVAQRVASILADGIPPAGIVAFTFTERAARSLKTRIEKRVAARMGADVLDKLNGMFVGTIHAYCFRVLQLYAPKYETFDVLDENRLTAFLSRRAKPLGIEQLEGNHFGSIGAFMSNLQVIENEPLEADQLDDPYREVYERYLADLEDHRFLTYGQIILRCVRELDNQRVVASVRKHLRHLIVDEYQDVNPAQEALIAKLAADPVHLCVVGDDDQSIYQWRGADVQNIVGFESRYPRVRAFRIERNRRSRPDIIAAANRVGARIEGRLPKAMLEHRPPSQREEVICWSAETEESEAELIAHAVKTAYDKHSYQYKDIAILCRGRVAFPAILEALKAERIPVQPGGRTHLFNQDDADLFGRTICWLVDHNWRKGQYGWSDEKVTAADLLSRYRDLYGLARKDEEALGARLNQWKYEVVDEQRRANLVGEFYQILTLLRVEDWDLSDPLRVNRLGTIARCTQVLADYESVRRRARPNHAIPGEMVGGTDRGKWHYAWLAIYIQNWAKGSFEDFEGEEDVELDAVDVTTIHQAKGLEWPLVFVPSLTASRFPTKRTGQPGKWHIPRHLFHAPRYEGSVNDERRLFYVAMTRARDQLSLSTFERKHNRQRPSPFLDEVEVEVIANPSTLPIPPHPDRAGAEPELLEATFSDLASYKECGLAYRLRRQIGFQPPLAPELGYGRAVHHVLRRLADHVRRYRRKPTSKELDRLFDDEFYLPAANKPAYAEMRKRARDLVDRYVNEWESDLYKTWEVERPFELHLGDATVSGRADVILDEAENTTTPQLTIVDYKTAADNHESHDFQLQVYTDAGRREGLDVDRAFVHDLREGKRFAVPVEQREVQNAEDLVRELVKGMRRRSFTPKPGKVCSRCDVRPICRYRAV